MTPNSPVERVSIQDEDFNPNAVLPHGLLPGDVKATLDSAHDFVYNLNQILQA